MAQATAPTPSVATAQPTVKAMLMAVPSTSPTHCATGPCMQSSTVMKTCSPMPTTSSAGPRNFEALVSDAVVSAADDSSVPAARSSALAASSAICVASPVAEPMLPEILSMTDATLAAARVARYPATLTASLKPDPMALTPYLTSLPMLASTLDLPQKIEV